MSPSVLIVDDHRLFCEGLACLIETRASLRVAGYATDGRQAVRMAGELAPDVVLMDVIMPSLNGMEAARQILAANSFTRVLALSMCTEERHVVGMLRAGATGYMLKDCQFQELEKAIRAVYEGQAYLSPAIAGFVIDDYLRRLARSDDASVLTPREREVLQLMAEGHSTKKIAEIIMRSDKTVEVHRRNLMRKLGTNNLAEITKYAIREGLVSL